MFKITNISKGRIVINSLNVILSGRGTKGDSFSVDSEKPLDKDIASLEKLGVILVEGGKIEKKQLEPAVKVKKTRVKKAAIVEENSKITPEPKSKKVTYVDGGKIKTGTMVQSIEHGGDIPNPLTVDDQAREVYEGEQDNLFI